mmetsp:Transcript_10889/g.23080  ORF Transcript_10889/g.23080 Transcript_10889/m.23080 type:complete len:115 (+) Transcript_10889:97-441(+)
MFLARDSMILLLPAHETTTSLPAHTAITSSAEVPSPCTTVRFSCVTVTLDGVLACRTTECLASNACVKKAEPQPPVPPKRVILAILRFVLQQKVVCFNTSYYGIGACHDLTSST